MSSSFIISSKSTLRTQSVQLVRLVHHFPSALVHAHEPLVFVIFVIKKQLDKAQNNMKILGNISIVSDEMNYSNSLRM